MVMPLNEKEASLIGVVRSLPSEEARKVLDWAVPLADLAGGGTVQWWESWTDEDLRDATAAAFRNFEDQDREDLESGDVIEVRTCAAHFHKLTGKPAECREHGLQIHRFERKLNLALNRVFTKLEVNCHGNENAYSLDLAKLSGVACEPELTQARCFMDSSVLAWRAEPNNATHSGPKLTSSGSWVSLVHSRIWISGRTASPDSFR